MTRRNARPDKIVEHVAAWLKGFRPILLNSAMAQIGEPDTRIRVAKCLEDGLGWNPFTEISREHAVRKNFVDYALQVDAKPVAFIEVKAIGANLAEAHLTQVVNYCVNAGVEWAILTNAVEYRVYHVEFTKPVSQSLVFKVHLLDQEPAVAARELATLHRIMFGRGALSDLWQTRSTLTTDRVVQMLFEEPVLRHIRTALKRRTGVKPPIEDIVKAMRRLLNERALEDLGEVKVGPVRRRRRKAKPAPPSLAESAQRAEAPAPTGAPEQEAVE